MKSNCLLTVSHGQGAQAMVVGVIGRELAAVYENVYIVSHYKWYADMLEQELPNVHSISYQELGQLYVTIMNDKPNWDIFTDHPYNIGKYVMREANFYNTYREICGLKTKKEDDNKLGATSMPKFVVSSAFEDAAKKFCNEHKKFVIMQTAGGQSVLDDWAHKPYPEAEVGLKRRYPQADAEKIVDFLVKDGYEVLQYALPNEPKLKGTIYMQQPQNALFYYTISKYAAFVVTIDSSLMHLSIANAPKVFVLWGQSASDKDSCLSFGYNKAVNIFPDNYTPVAPFFNGIPDTPVIKFVSPNKVIAKIKEYLGEKE